MSSSSWVQGGVGVAMLVGITLGGCATPAPLPSIEESNVPLAGLSDAALAQFNRGKALVSRVFTANEGLGPLYIEASCASCHEQAGRGPGKVTRMAVETPEGEAVYDRALPYGTVVRPHVCAGATHGVVPPAGIDGHRIDVPAAFRAETDTMCASESIPYAHRGLGDYASARKLASTISTSHAETGSRT